MPEANSKLMTETRNTHLTKIKYPSTLRPFCKAEKKKYNKKPR